MFSDAHIHCYGPVDGATMLRAMDEVEMERAVVIAPQVLAAEDFDSSLATITGLTAADPARLVPFAWIEPTLPAAPEHVRRARDAGVRGIKMIPDHWYPYEERLFPAYGAIQDAGLPLLFHSGILWANGDSSRFCRPAFYEVMLHFPRVRFMLAHIGWPWTDECIAVFGRMRSAVREGLTEQCNMWVDITRGTPDMWREEALRKAMAYAGADRLVYGSDSRAGAPLTGSRHGVFTDRDIICERLGYDEADFEKVAKGNLAAFLGEG